MTQKVHIVPGRQGVLHKDCEDYNVGPFTPVSFEPKLKWKIYESTPDKKLELARRIKFSAHCFNGDLLVSSRPFSGGCFCLDHYELDIRTIRLETTDPEEALYLAEQFIKNCAKTRAEFYQLLLKIFD